jgi:ABC-type multidrug transport system ATPase subunit
LLTNTTKTVFISSHLLAEIERMATHVGIINNGELLFQGSISRPADLLSQPLVFTLKLITLLMQPTC